MGDSLRRIIRLQLDRIVKRTRENHRTEMVYAEGLVDAVAARCTESESGARNIDHILTHGLLPELSAEFLSRMAAGQSFGKVEVDTDDAGRFRIQVS
jgi:type VI secretion system protein VasG